ncbi:hypothetical protein JB92DRAFT_2811086 [Gautieria morchelliformis]|nr:hypothetical protein JB92DRAFT_2811086 [Gautieria morchelliformis]
MPPKGKRKSAATSIEGSVPPQGPTLSESLSYLHLPRPFKNPYYTKNFNRRTKGLKYVLAAEREKLRHERDKAKDAMAVDGEETKYGKEEEEDSEMPTYTSIEAPPSVLPQKHYCDITGLEAPYTDPATNLRYHDKSIYDLIKNLNPDAEKAYLAARGVNPVVK